MSNNTIQASLAAGELSPALFARVDLAKYHVGAALLRNFFVNYTGGVSNRAGLEYIGRCLDGINRLISFQFSTVQAYALLFSDLKMRVIMDGGFVLETAQTISAITQASTGVLTYVGTDPSNGDWMYLLTEGMTELNTRTVMVGSVDTGANTFNILDLDGNPISTSAYGAFTSGTMARIYTQTSPYAAEDLALLKFTQSADTMTFTHVSYPPYKLTRSGHATWTFTQITFEPIQTPPSGVVVSPSSAGSTSYRYVSTAVNANGLTESRASGSGSTTASATMSLTAGAFETIDISAATGALYYNFYRQAEVPGSAAATGSLYGFVGQSSSAGTAAFVDANIEPDFTQTPPTGNNPFENGTNYYPGCVTYFDGRQIFAGSNNLPQTLWCSKSGDFFNMDYSTPARADDSITATLNSAQVNAIQHLVPMQSLIAMTTGGAFKIDGGSQADTITPTGNFSAKQQVYNGCSVQVPPIVANNELLYVQAKGSIVRDLSYNLYANVYTGIDLTSLSGHLFYGHTILEWAYAEEPFKIIWSVRDDGILLSLTFLKDQEIYAWAHSDTQGLFKSVCSVSEPPEDAVYFVVQRTIPGVNDGNPVQYVERLHSRNFMLGNAANVCLAFFADSALQYPLVFLDANATPSASTGTMTLTADSPVFDGTMVGNILRINNGVATITSVFDASHVAASITVDLEEDDFGNKITAQAGSWSCTAPTDTVTGLWHLEGATVTILAGGGVAANMVVEDGSVTIDHAEDVIVVGLPYVAQMQSLYLDIQGVPTVQGKRKKISAVTVRSENTRGLSACSGPVFENMKQIKQRSNEPMGQPTRMTSGDMRVVLEPKWEETGQICLQQDFPLPASILGLIPEIQIGDN